MRSWTDDQLVLLHACIFAQVLRLREAAVDCAPVVQRDDSAEGRARISTRHSEQEADAHQRHRHTDVETYTSSVHATSTITFKFVIFVSLGKRAFVCENNQKLGDTSFA